MSIIVSDQNFKEKSRDNARCSENEYYIIMIMITNIATRRHFLDNEMKENTTDLCNLDIFNFNLTSTLRTSKIALIVDDF